METLKSTARPTFDKKELKKAIQKEYAEVACNPDHKIHFLSGRPLAEFLEYDAKVLEMIPEEAIRLFAGVGNPFQVEVPEPDSLILDIGSGGGLDCMVASLLAKNNCQVIGLDMTREMVEKAESNVQAGGFKNIQFILGQAENILLPDNSVDLVISNGVINLCPDKDRVYKEIYRVLKRGGKFQLADVVLKRPVPNDSRELIHLWTNCVAGAIPMEDYLSILTNRRFSAIHVQTSFDVFKNAKIAKSAAFFGAKGYNISATK